MHVCKKCWKKRIFSPLSNTVFIVTCFRNFPTAETVKRKNEIIQEKIARGEVIETKTFG